MRWRPKLNETPNPIQTNKHKFKRKLANANSKENKNEKRCFGFCHFVFAWRCTGLATSDFSDFHSNEGAATPLCKKKEKVKIEIDSTVEAEVEPKVESKVECDGVRN